MWDNGEGYTDGRARGERPARPRVVIDPMHVWKLLARKPGDLPSGRRLWRVAVRIGKAEEADADDGRAAEVGLLHSTEEAGEQRPA